MSRLRVSPRSLLAVQLVLVLGLMGGCGSQLQPDEVAGASGPRGIVPAGAEVADVASAGPGTSGVDLGGQLDPTAGPIVASGGDPGGGDGGGGAAGPDDGGDDGGGGAGPDDDGEPAPATGDEPKGDCDGLQNGNGITDDTITIGNAADVSGPVPGIFQASQDAVQAYVAFFNATTDLCGRKLALTAYDTRTDGVAEQEAYVRGCDEVFAMVGSMSAFDSSGAGATVDCGLPDLRTAGITPERIACATCFGALSSNPGEFQNAVPDFVLDTYPEAGQHAAMLYINIGAAPDNALAQVEIFTKRGMKFDYVQAIDVSEFNYVAYVQAMKDRGIEYVQMIGSDSTAVRLAQTMQQQGFEPTIFMNDPSVYRPGFVSTGGSAVEGTVVFTSVVPFEEADSNDEMATYLAWLDQVKPGAEPSFFGAYAWSAARLFVESAAALGGRLDRASLVAALSEVDGWTAGGLHAPQRVGVKRVGECNRFIVLRGGTWVPVGGTKYTCTGTTTLR